MFHTRFISVSDDYDSANFRGDTGGMNVAFKYLINEYYSRDMSIKTRSAKYAKMERGEYQSKICPYGYRKGANGRMEPDGEAAETVKLPLSIFPDSQQRESPANCTGEESKRPESIKLRMGTIRTIYPVLKESGPYPPFSAYSTTRSIPAITLSGEGR